MLCVRGRGQDEIKVVDFGIAVQETQAHKLQGTAAGTLEYMAPELLFGRPPSVAADLYAVGVLAYELLTGQFPFERKSRTQLLAQVLGTRAEMTLPDHIAAMFASGTADLAVDGEAPPQDLRANFEAHLATLEPRLQTFLRQLLAREPAERYRDATAALDEVNRVLQVPLPLETTEIRESFLQASRLIGRDAELARFELAIDGALKSAGCAVLLGGESGVGKSRLLEEIRALALVRGMLVMRGHAVAAAGQPCQVWLEVLRHLCLYIDLTDQEAGVLKSLLPDLPVQLGRAVPDATHLDAQASQSRLLGIAESMLARLTLPSLIILEDLHWADADSLALLRRVAGSVSKQPLVILASYRSDERPDLPAALPMLETWPLRRLTSEGIAELAAAMVGKTAQDPKLLALLDSEAAGNPHFIVEIFRVLAESAGGLDAIDQGTLKQKLFSGGIREVLRRRLERVPAAARPMLRLAAVAGRQLDLRVLGALEPQLDELLRICAAVAVLEVSDRAWRFSHDRLRERLLADIPEDEKRLLHLRFAAALEKIAVDEPGNAAVLAYHYRQGADPERSARYAALAGEQALHSGALSEAVALLTGARELQTQLSRPRIERARVLRLLASALWGLGRLGEGLPIMEEALALLGEPPPSSALQVGVKLLGLSSRQLVHRLAPRSIRQPPPGQQRERLDELLRIMLGSGEMYAWTGDQGKMLYSSLLSVNLAEQLDDSAALVMLYAVMGFLGAVMGLPAMRDHYFAIAEARLTRADDPKAELELYRISGALHLMRGQWGSALVLYDKAIAMARTLGNGPLLLFCLLQRATVCYWRADYAEAEADSTAMLKAARRDSFVQYQVWALGTLGASALRRGGELAMATASQALEEAHTLAQRENDMTSRIFVSGLRALCTVRLGDGQLARRLADDALAEIERTAITGHGALEGFLSLLEAYLELAEMRPTADEKSALMQRLQSALPKMGRYARLVPIGTARTLLCEGRLALLQGRPAQALRLFRRSLEAAQTFALPYDEALSHYWLGRLARTDAAPGSVWPDARVHLDAAQRLLQRIGATLPGSQDRIMRSPVERGARNQS